MKVAVTSAFGWPYVRRGNRVAYELADYLASRGNNVHLLTTKPGPIRREKFKRDLLIKYYPIIDHPFLTKFNIQYWQTFALTCFKALLKENYDLVYTCLTMDTCTAGLLNVIRGTPFIVLLINGEPLYKDARRARPFFKRAIKRASRLVTISHYVNEVLKRDFGLEGIMIPCPVDTSKFVRGQKTKTDFPRILCTATLTMERKRVPLLVKAFQILLEQFPTAILQLAGETSPEVTGNLLKSVSSKARRSIQFLNINSDEDLAACYGKATISVLPSLKEPFGMVTTESLASGTPVVGTRSGGTQEILDNPDVGVLFEPTDGPNELCGALIKGIELAYDSQTAGRCSRHAEHYSWKKIGPKYEELQQDVLNLTKKRTRSPKKVDLKKMSPDKSENQTILSNGHIKMSRLNKIFFDRLDALEITSSDYYEIESQKPKYLHFLDWIFNRIQHRDSTLIVSKQSHFLASLLKESGIEACQDFDPNRLEDAMQTSGCSSDAPELEKISGNFDVIICDDLLQYWAWPLKNLQALRKRLSHRGVLLLSTLNAARSASRRRLLMGRNIYPWYDDPLINTVCFNNDVSLRSYREYTQQELEELLPRAGLKLIKKSRIIGNIKIEKSVNFSSVAVKTYLLHKFDRQIQSLASPLRSHFFVVLKKSLSKLE